MLRCPGCNQPIREVTCAVDPRTAGYRFTAGCGDDVHIDLARHLWDAGMRWHVPPITGATLVGAERDRHAAEEGHTRDEDAARTSSELSWAAWCLLDRAAAGVDPGHDGPPPVWPLPRERWPFGKTPLRLLIIAGSFIAAEIDRRLAAGERP